MVETPREVKRRKGASPMDGARVMLHADFIADKKTPTTYLVGVK
jgi:hypothetical protein